MLILALKDNDNERNKNNLELTWTDLKNRSDQYLLLENKIPYRMFILKG